VAKVKEQRGTSAADGVTSTAGCVRGAVREVSLMSKRGWSFIALAAAIAVAGCASEDWQTKYEEQQKQNLDIVSENEQLKQHRAEEAAKAEQLAQQIRQNDIEAQKARQAADAALRQNEALRQQMAAAQTAPKSSQVPASSPVVDDRAMQALAAQLKSELGKQADHVGVTKDGNIEITLSSDVNFAVGSADLSEAGKKSLKSVAPMLKGKFAPYQIRVEGHTDATPVVRGKEKYKDNFGLGSARSLSVVRFMESELSIEPTRLMSASRGEHEPVADNKTDTGKKQNRRVEIVVVLPHDAAMSLAK
jgi:chemotaxis protein MotB